MILQLCSKKKNFDINKDATLVNLTKVILMPIFKLAVRCDTSVEDIIVSKVLAFVTGFRYLALSCNKILVPFPVELYFRLLESVTFDLLESEQNLI